jgi:hypothetical protein
VLHGGNCRMSDVLGVSNTSTLSVDFVQRRLIAGVGRALERSASPREPRKSNVLNLRIYDILDVVTWSYF